MAQTRKLNCFIAMAFDQEDTDKVYQRSIMPTLRQLNLRPRRVDKIEHNDKIDDRIIRELLQCDLAIADLTYARPSVYYEAGFAERNVPVVYTCRTDHLLGKKMNPDEKLRVHFDLQNKNIVKWLDPTDPTFAVRLKERLVYVTGPLIRQQALEIEKSKERESFARLSQVEKVLQLMQLASREALRSGFLPGTFPIPMPESSWAGSKLMRGNLQMLHVRVVPGFSYQAARSLMQDMIIAENAILEGLSSAKQKTVKAIHEHLIIISLGRIPLNQIKRALPHAQLGETANDLVWRKRYPHILDWSGSGEPIQHPLTTFHFLPSIEDLSEVGCRVRSLLDGLKSKAARAHGSKTASREPFR